MPDLPESSVVRLLNEAQRITVLTGAGISTECGVPDFRSPGSPWLIHKPIGFAAFMADAAARAEAWRRKFAMDDLYRGAKPGRCHHALVRLARSGRLRTVITQNIDGLQQAAGLDEDRLIELHGNGTFARCLNCEKRFELDEVRSHLNRTGAALACSCGGFVKSATIAFGQQLQQRTIDAAVEAAQDCDLFLAVGSSLVVRPAATLPLLARARGAVLLVVNREATPLDSAAHLAVRAEAGDVLDQVAIEHREHTP